MNSVLSQDVWQQQLDELVALGSILEGDFRLTQVPGRNIATSCQPIQLEDLYSLDLPSGPGRFSCEVYVHVEVPTTGLQLAISTNPDELLSPSIQQVGSSSKGSSPAPGQLHHSSTSIQCGKVVRHLPPIHMQLTFPASYPEHSSPMVELHAVWLKPRDTAKLGTALQALWDAHGSGEPVCFQWVEWLRESSLTELGLVPACCLTLTWSAHDTSSPADHTNKQPCQHGCETACRPSADVEPDAHDSTCADHESMALDRQLLAQRGTVPPEQLALGLVRYSNSRADYLFRSEPCTCPVCFDDLPGFKCIRLPDCGHYACLSCFKTYVETKVADGAVEAIYCMDPSCRQPVPVGVIRAVLPPDLYARWEELLLHRTLDKMSDITYCPRCQSTCLEDADHCAQCPKCYYVFCGLCVESWHPGSKCLTPEEIMARDSALKECPHLDVTGVGRQQRIAAFLDYAKSMQAIREMSKPCPSCKMAISKTEGCNKMKCSYCNTSWCYVCSQIIIDYSHYRDGSCRLFSVDELARWNEQMAQMGFDPE